MRPWEWGAQFKGRFCLPCFTLTWEASQSCVSAPRRGSTCCGWLAKMTVNHHLRLSPALCQATCQELEFP